MTNVSRRSIAKGAAWSVPAVVVGAPAAMAATSFPQITCPPTPSVSDTGLKSISIASGTRRSYDQASGHSDIGMGSFFSINLGMWQFAKPADYVTGYKVTFGDYVGVTTVSGVKSRGTAPSGGVETPQVIGAGLAAVVGTQTAVPYKLVAKKAYNFPAGVSIPITITYLAGLDSNLPGNTTVGTCSYFINYTYTANPDVFGNYPDSPQVANSGNAYSITTNALYGS